MNGLPRSSILLVVLVAAALGAPVHARGLSGPGLIEPDWLTTSDLYHLGGVRGLGAGRFHVNELAGGGAGEYMPRMRTGDVGHPRYRGLNVGGGHVGRFGDVPVGGFSGAKAAYGINTGLHPVAPGGLLPEHGSSGLSPTRGTLNRFYALPSDGGLHALGYPVK